MDIEPIDKIPWWLRLFPGAILLWVIVTLLLAGVVWLLMPQRDFDQGSAVAPFLFLLPLWSLAAAILVRLWTSIIWRRRAAAVLSYVEQAVRLELPLSMAVMASARGESGIVRERLVALYQMLETGASLPGALAAAVPEMDGESVRAVGSAVSINQVPRALRRLTARLLPRTSENREIAGFYRGYFLVTMLLVVTLVVCLVQIFVFPKFRTILSDFHAAPPPSMTLLMSEDAQWFFMLCALALALAAFVFSFSGVREKVIWKLPIIGRARQGRAMAEFCWFMVDAVELGRPMDEALSLAADSQPSAVLRRRIMRWTIAVKKGQPLADSARAEGMPKLTASMLATVRSGDDLLQVFAFLARHYEARFSRLEELVDALTAPFLALVMGAATLLVGLSVIQPIAEMINALSHVGGGSYGGGFNGGERFMQGPHRGPIFRGGVKSAVRTLRL
jgi:MSHA biogenesis protein MshG